MGWVFLTLLEGWMFMSKSMSSDRLGRGANQLLLCVAALSLFAGMALPARAGDIPRAKMHAAPVYPQVAKSNGISGEVYVEAVVDPEGNVKDVRPVAGNLLLSTAARQAVRQWKFAPGVTDRVVVVAFNFTNP
jgi:TonB family protein